MHKAMDRMVVRTEAMERICKARQAELMARYERGVGVDNGLSKSELDEMRRLINRRVCITLPTQSEDWMF